MPAGLVLHLARRFWRSLSRRPPAPADAAWGEAFLRPDELRLWRQLSNVDRRHALEVARSFHEVWPDASRAELAGALLHDIGKLDAQLGTVLRVLASVIGPRTDRLRRYHDHEAIGARWLQRDGSDPVTVALVDGSAAASDDRRLGSAAAALRWADDL
jgi:hypothetical protein